MPPDPPSKAVSAAPARKRALEDLALFGGRPAFEQPLHVGRPNLPDRERLLERIGGILDRRWLSNDGPCVQELERRVAEQVGARHCLATCNATVALEILVRAVGLLGEVVVPSFTFIATAHALEWQGLTPVFCDVDPSTHTIDPDSAEARITERTSAILGVHLWGRPCDVDALEALALRRGLILLFDAAHAFGCSHRGTMVGNFGRAEVFSFHATKFVNAGEGGAIVTNDDGLAERIRLLRNFGFVGYDAVEALGTNGKLSEIPAALGLGSLEAMETIVAVNRRNHEAYRHGLADLPGVGVLAYEAREACNYQYVVLEIEEAQAGITRDELQEILWAENVMARRYFYPGCHRMEPYRSREPDAGARLPHTEALAARVLSVPTGTAVSLEDVETICGMLRLVVRGAAEARALLVLRERPARHPA